MVGLGLLSAGSQEKDPPPTGAAEERTSENYKDDGW